MKENFQINQVMYTSEKSETAVHRYFTEYFPETFPKIFQTAISTLHLWPAASGFTYDNCKTSDTNVKRHRILED